MAHMINGRRAINVAAEYIDACEYLYSYDYPGFVRYGDLEDADRFSATEWPVFKLALELCGSTFNFGKDLTEEDIESYHEDFSKVMAVNWCEIWHDLHDEEIWKEPNDL